MTRASASSDWRGVNWAQPTSAIAAERGVAISTVSKARRRYAPETLGAYSGRAAAAPVDDLQRRLKAATARADVLLQERDHLRQQLAVARRAFTTTDALLRDVLEERDAALTKLAAASQPAPAADPPADPMPPPATKAEGQPIAGRKPGRGRTKPAPAPPAAAEPRKLPTPAGLTRWQPVTGPDAAPLPPAAARPRRPRAPATERALATALEQHPDLAESFPGGTLTDTWHNPGAASGVETHDHP